MALEKGPRLDWSAKANSDLSALQFQFVKFHGTATNDSIVPVTAITDLPLGILANTPLANQECQVDISGIVKGRCGAVVTRNDLIGTDVAGLVVKVTPGTDITKYVLGRALESGVANQVISVLLGANTPYLAK